MATADHPITPAVDAVRVETLERLARLDPRGHPILSVYVDLDPRHFPTPDARATELGALLDGARREAGDVDADRVQSWLSANSPIARGARGLAIFSSAPADIFEVVRLPARVEPQAVVDSVPWLESLAAMVSPGDWGVAVVSRRAVRLLRGGPAGLTQFAAITDELHRRHAQGGWSQARYQRRIEEQVAAHVRGVADRMLRAHLRRPFQQLVIVCSDELRPLIEHTISTELRGMLAGIVAADLEHASAAEIAAAVEPVVERTEREGERDLIAQLEHGLGIGGRAVAGLGDVLSTLERQQVEILFVGERGNLKAGLCPTCGRLSSEGSRRCPLDGAFLVEVDAIEHAVEVAARQSARVVVARYEQQWLRDHGDVASLLRW